VQIGRTLLLFTVLLIAASGFAMRSLSQPENERYTNLYPALDALNKEVNKRGIALKERLDTIEEQGGMLVRDNPLQPTSLITAEGIGNARDLIHQLDTILQAHSSAIDRFLRDMATLIASAKIHESDRNLAMAGFEWNRAKVLHLEKVSMEAYRESASYAAKIVDLCESQLGRVSLDANGNLSFLDADAKAQLALLLSMWRAHGEKEHEAGLEVRSFLANVRWRWLVPLEGY
jgi:hypothetical protein